MTTTTTYFIAALRQRDHPQNDDVTTTTMERSPRRRRPAEQHVHNSRENSAAGVFERREIGPGFPVGLARGLSTTARRAQQRDPDFSPMWLPWTAFHGTIPVSVSLAYRSPDAADLVTLMAAALRRIWGATRLLLVVPLSVDQARLQDAPGAPDSC
jgi:hypothetical protein